ncbi:MAG: hypothetical protein V2B13_15825 [Pseudomonadota bacterium]
MSRLWTGHPPLTLSEHGVLLALSPPWAAAALSALQSAGVSPQIADTTEEAIQSLKFQQPDFLLLSENFCSRDDHPNPLLDYIQRMPTRLRREFFVIFIGTIVKSGDLLSAFSYSVNLVLQPDKLPDLVAYITESWTIWKELYQMFIQSRIQLTGY